MKKKIIFLMLLVAISINGQSQALIALLFGSKLSTPKLMIGIQLGGNLSFQSNSTYKSPLPNFAFGAYVNYKASPKWHLNTFLTLKSNRGVNGLDTSYSIFKPVDTSLTSATLQRKLTYIDINPEFQFLLSKSFAIGAGPVISILTGAKDYYKGTKGDAQVTEQYNIYKNLNLFDVGVSLDLQYTWKKGEGLSINLKYIQGFLNPYKNGVNPSAMTSFLNLGLGIPIKSHKKEDFDKSNEEKNKK
jgi:hypothetical protein